jgi:hypothetical protein
MNIRSLTNKLHHFETILTEISPDIVVLTETWISNKIMNESISVTNYEIVARTDRLNTTDGRGGGIVIYTKSDIAPEIVNLTPPPTLKNYQLCRVDIRNVSITGIYRSPKTTLEEDKQIVPKNRKKNPKNPKNPQSRVQNQKIQIQNTKSGVQIQKIQKTLKKVCKIEGTDIVFCKRIGWVKVILTVHVAAR